MDRVEKFLGDRYSDNSEVLNCLTKLYREYNSWGLKDVKFDIDFTDGRDEHFYPYIWEMLLASHLKSVGLEISSSEAGPDFKVNFRGQTIWFEAICPSPAGIPEDWVNRPQPEKKARVCKVPHSAMLLRWTAALKEKKEKLTGAKNSHSLPRKTRNKIGYLNKGIVGRSDPYVIAINSSRLGFGTDLIHRGISQFPFAVEAAFPIGPIEIVVNRDSLEMIEQRYSHRVHIKKLNGAEVPTDSFLNLEYKEVSAILGSPAGINAVCGEKTPLVIVHNPLAKNKLPVGILGADEEYIAEDKGGFYELRDISAGA